MKRLLRAGLLQAVWVGVLLVVVAGCERKRIPDLTGLRAAAFKEHLDQVVALQGRLEEGQRGLTLAGAVPGDVVFYVVSVAGQDRAGSYPELWTKRLHREVRLTGKLRFKTFEPTLGTPLLQQSPDFYFMVLQQTQIEDVNPR